MNSALVLEKNTHIFSFLTDLYFKLGQLYAAVYSCIQTNIKLYTAAYSGIQLNVQSFCTWQMELDSSNVFFNHGPQPEPLPSLWTKCWDVRKFLKAYHRMAIIEFYLGTNKQQLMTRVFLNSGSCHLVRATPTTKTLSQSHFGCVL
jgi:hypothetical protein